MIERTRTDASSSDPTLDEHGQEHAPPLQSPSSLRPLELHVRATPSSETGSKFRVLHEVWVRRAVGSVMVCAIALLALQPWKIEASASSGAPHVGLFIEHDGSLTRAESGALVYAGDVLRFTYSTGSDAYLALLNADAQGGVRVYYPTSGWTAQLARAGSDIALGSSAQLDDRPGVERVLAMFCPAPFDTQPLVVALLSAGTLPAQPECQVDVFRLRKQPAP